MYSVCRHVGFDALGTGNFLITWMQWLGVPLLSFVATVGLSARYLQPPDDDRRFLEVWADYMNPWGPALSLAGNVVVTAIAHWSWFFEARQGLEFGVVLLVVGGGLLFLWIGMFSLGHRTEWLLGFPLQQPIGKFLQVVFATSLTVAASAVGALWAFYIEDLQTSILS